MTVFLLLFFFNPLVGPPLGAQRGELTACALKSPLPLAQPRCSNKRLSLTLSASQVSSLYREGADLLGVWDAMRHFRFKDLVSFHFRKALFDFYGFLERLSYCQPCVLSCRNPAYRHTEVPTRGPPPGFCPRLCPDFCDFCNSLLAESASARRNRRGIIVFMDASRVAQHVTVDVADVHSTWI